MIHAVALGSGWDVLGYDETSCPTGLIQRCSGQWETANFLRHPLKTGPDYLALDIADKCPECCQLVASDIETAIRIGYAVLNELAANAP